MPIPAKDSTQPSLLVVSGIDVIYDEPGALERVLQAIEESKGDVLLNWSVERTDISGQRWSPELAGNKYAKVILDVAKGCENSVDVTFDGWETDPREIHQVPEIQRFCAGFLGRNIPGSPERTIGKWEGRILRKLRVLDALGLIDPTLTQGRLVGGGCRVRIFGSAEQLRPHPLVRWADTGQGYNAEATLGLMAIQAAMDESPLGIAELSTPGYFGWGKTIHESEAEETWGSYLKKPSSF